MATEQVPGWLWLIPAWAVYFALHSTLASLAVKRRVERRWPGAGRWYRLAYNGLAILLLLPIAVVLWRYPGPQLWAWQGPWFWLANGLALLALLAFYLSLRWYDTAEFLGTRQLGASAGGADQPGRLCISPFHRYVRHPWYSFGLVLVWTRDMNAAMLVSALAISAYFVIGSRLEERKLIAFHGRAYRDYAAAVPGLLPRPWRHLDSRSARRLEQSGGVPDDDERPH